MNWFSNRPTFGDQDLAEVIDTLKALDDEELKQILEEKTASTEGQIVEIAWQDFMPWRSRLWYNTTHRFGYIRQSPENNDVLTILPANKIEPDHSLKNSKINVRLNNIQVASYPGGTRLSNLLGGGVMHHILFDFYAQNHLEESVESLHYSLKMQVREGQQAAIAGYPIFIGLNVGNMGLAFQCLTINVGNVEDIKFIGMLESSVMQSGLQLVSHSQPALVPFTELVTGITKGIAERNKNVEVQNFLLGLDFQDAVIGARLAIGSYVAVQIPKEQQMIWDWSDWVYHSNKQQIVRRDNADEVIPFNYIMFSITRYDS